MQTFDDMMPKVRKGSEVCISLVRLCAMSRPWAGRSRTADLDPNLSARDAAEFETAAQNSI